MDCRSTESEKKLTLIPAVVSLADICLCNVDVSCFGPFAGAATLHSCCH